MAEYCFSDAKAVSYRNINEYARRTDAVETSADDLVLMADTSRMTPKVLRVFSIRLEEALERTEFRRVRQAGRVAGVAYEAAAAEAAKKAAEEAERAEIERLAQSSMGQGVDDGSDRES